MMSQHVFFPWFECPDGGVLRVLSRRIVIGVPIVGLKITSELVGGCNDREHTGQQLLDAEQKGNDAGADAVEDSDTEN